MEELNHDVVLDTKNMKNVETMRYNLREFQQDRTLYPICIKFL